VVQVGESMENPVSGERFIWRATAASTGGAYCEFDLFLSPGARIAAAHRHPSQLETFSVLSGALEMKIAGFCRLASNGQLNKAGLPRNPLQFAVLADRHRGELQLPSPLAQAVAGPAARALAVIGRAAGFRPDGTRAVRAR
jgi:hypothetical protein